ncbi:hypothetical protein [Hymenobacter convexus]|uniref:hypothetical protein n=1 Tax=Hymenobacter sp. CA1UV-4 TaxID=3063782 RepID=UPI002713422A|nr:hypothetical protein [Hymenobacter sp. CA1UV-4]MDO7853578.1 hypothetical protein [Hymenobacter sp. CA1UV-4]
MLLSSCVVYMPMQCAAPQITDKKQGEVTASSYLNGRFDIAANYSPVRHLLVRAAYSNLRDDTKDTTYYRGHQYEFGAGTYWPLGNRWLVGGLGGFGQARSTAAFNRPGIIFPSTHYVYDARYNKIFGEVYGTFQANEAVSFGAAYRITQVNFTTLTNQAVPIDLNRMTRSEPMVYFRVRLGDGPTENRPVQLQAAWGTSATFGYNEGDTSISYDQGVRDLKQGRGYTTIGITIFPHCLFRKAQPAGEGR